MVSDSYKVSTDHNQACLVAKAKYIPDRSKGSGGGTIADLAKEYELNELQLSQDDFVARVRPYVKRVV